MKILPFLSVALFIVLTHIITNFSFPTHWDESIYLMSGYLAVHQHITNHGILDGIQFIFSIPWLISGITIDSPLISSPFLIDHEYPSRIFTEYLNETYQIILERGRQLSLIISIVAIGISCYFVAKSMNTSLRKNCILILTALALFTFAMPNIKLIYSSVLIEPYTFFIIGLSVYYLCTPNASNIILIFLVIAPFLIKLSILPVTIFCTIKFVIENRYKGYKKVGLTLLIGFLLLYIFELLVVLRQPIASDPQLQNLQQQIGIITQYESLNKIIFFSVAPLDRLLQIANFVKAMLTNGSLDFYWNGNFYPRNLSTKFYFLNTNFNFFEVLLIVSSPILTIAMCFFERKNISLLLVSFLFASVAISVVVLNNSFSAHYYAIGGIISLVCLVYFCCVKSLDKTLLVPFITLTLAFCIIYITRTSESPDYHPLLIDSGERSSGLQQHNKDQINFGTALNNRYHPDLLTNIKNACLNGNTRYRLASYENKHEFTVAKYFLLGGSTLHINQYGFMEGKLNCDLVNGLFGDKKTDKKEIKSELIIIECDAIDKIAAPIYLINSCGDECQKYSPYPVISKLNEKYYYLFTGPIGKNSSVHFVPSYPTCKIKQKI